MTENLTRIAVLTPYLSVDYLGGTEIFIDQLQRALGDLEVFADSKSVENSPRWHLERIGLEEPYRALRVARSFLKEHRTKPFQLAISNGLYGWPLSLRHLDIPLVQVYHFTMAGLARHALPLRGDRLTTGTISAFFDRLAGRGKYVVAVSDSVLREVESYYGLSGRVMLNTVDTTLFRQLDRHLARKALGLSARAPIGLFVGRAEYAKGFDIFLEVARSLRNVTFVAVGNSSHIEPNVRALGNIPHSKMPLCYSAADFLFLPSRYEGFNLSILEALACNLPIVVSEAAYNLTADPYECGYVAKSLQPREFVQGIREVLDRSSSYDPSKAVVATYTFEVFRDNWSSLVRRLLEKANTKRERGT